MKFSNEQIELMRSIGLDFDFNNLSDDESCEIALAVGDELTLHCLDKDYNPNARGKICEEILWHLDD